MTGDRGAWYCAFELATAMAEIIFHKTVEYQEIDRFYDSVSYQALLADFSGQFHELRDAGHGGTFVACLDPSSYLVSQQLAAAAARRRFAGHRLSERPARRGNQPGVLPASAGR
jgi:hypothetical protein